MANRGELSGYPLVSANTAFGKIKKNLIPDL